MSGNKILITLLGTLLSFVFGCETIREAHKTQESLAEKANGKRSECKDAAVELKGASLEKLVDFAMTNRPETIEAELNVEDAHLAIKQLKGDAPLISSSPWTAPKLNVGLSYAESSTPVHSSKLQDSSFERGKMKGFLSLDLLIYDFGRHDASVNTAVEKALSAELKRIDVGYDIFEEVSGAYFDVLEAQSLLAVAELTVNQYSAHLDQAKLQFEQGELKQIDVTKAELDLSEAKDALVEAENTLETSGAKLLKALGITIEQAKWTDIVGERNTEIDRRVEVFAKTDITEKELFDIGYENYPALSIARANLRAASSEVDYRIADMRPSISASGSLNFSDPLWWWQWGASASQNLFSGFKNETAIERAVAQMKIASTKVDQVEHDMSLAISLWVAERDNSRVALITSEETVKNAKLFLDLAQARFDVGDVNRVDLQDSVTDYGKALGQKVKAFYRAQKSESKLFRIKGERPWAREIVETKEDGE